MTKDNGIYKLWIIIYPVIIHSVVLSISSALFTDSGVFTATLAGLITLPVFITLYYKDKKKLNTSINSENIKSYDMIFVVIAGIAACLGLNFLITFIQLYIPSNDYEVTAKTIYSSPLILQLIGVGIIVPIAEEFIFRGLIFNRLKIVVRGSLAIFTSALIFGIYHGGVAQGIYAFVLGLILAFLYEKHGTILTPILFHITANITSLVIQQMNLTVDAVTLIISSIICLTILIFVIYR